MFSGKRCDNARKGLCQIMMYGPKFGWPVLGGAIADPDQDHVQFDSFGKLPYKLGSFMPPCFSHQATDPVTENRVAVFLRHDKSGHYILLILGGDSPVFQQDVSCPFPLPLSKKSTERFASAQDHFPG